MANLSKAVCHGESDMPIRESAAGVKLSETWYNILRMIFVGHTRSLRASVPWPAPERSVQSFDKWP
jgi:hypothetical protein